MKESFDVVPSARNDENFKEIPRKYLLQTIIGVSKHQSENTMWSSFESNQEKRKEKWIWENEAKRRLKKRHHK